jgi:hypothetical protein
MAVAAIAEMLARLAATDPGPIVADVMQPAAAAVSRGLACSLGSWPFSASISLLGIRCMELDAQFNGCSSTNVPGGIQKELSRASPLPRSSGSGAVSRCCAGPAERRRTGRRGRFPAPRPVFYRESTGVPARGRSRFILYT